MSSKVKKSPTLNRDIAFSEIDTSTPPSKKANEKYLLITNALNRSLADGFAPHNPDIPDHPQSAILETARRLGIPSDLLLQGLKKNLISPINDYYQSDKPHETFLASMRAAGLEITSDDSTRRHILRLTDETKRLRKALESTDRDTVTAEEVRTEIYKLSALPPTIPDWLSAPRHGKSGPGLPITLWSDWHYGEVIRQSHTSGTNLYNIAVADKRIEMLVDRICDIALNHQVSPNYPGIVVCLGGDMFSGDGLHEELTRTNEATVLETFTMLQGRLIWSFKRLADEFGQVCVPCAFGNHSRNTQKPQYKLSAETNYEYLLFNQLELYFKNDSKYSDKVQFLVSPENGIHFTVGSNKKGNNGHKYYLTHGDMLGVKGGDGIIGPLGPIKRGDFKVRDSERSIGLPYDTLVMGHWHQYQTLPGIIVNGSLKGWDEYARNNLRAAFDFPAQALWFNHPTYGPNPHYKIILTEDACGKKAKPGADVFSSKRPGNGRLRPNRQQSLCEG